MRLGVNALPDVGGTDLAVLAEELGYDGFYVGDNPLMWSDPYAALALAAKRTSSIRLGTFVAVAGVRSAVVTANALASINRLAPGRVVCGIGSGNTARRMAGRAPLKIDSLAAYLAELRSLLAGEEVETSAERGRQFVLAHAAGDPGFVAFEPRIPLLISAFGPRAMGLAGRLGDGLIGGLGVEAEYVAEAWGQVEAGADAAGRSLDEDFEAISLTSMCVLDDGEGLDSPRVLEQVGGYAMTTLQYAYLQHWLAGVEPPSFLADVWEGYVAAVERVPEERRHLRVLLGHSTWLADEDRAFVTPELLAATAMIGTAAELAGRVRELEATGRVTELVLCPAHDVAAAVIRDVAERVLPLLRRGPGAAAAARLDG